LFIPLACVCIVICAAALSYATEKPNCYKTDSEHAFKKYSVDSCDSSFSAACYQQKGNSFVAVEHCRSNRSEKPASRFSSSRVMAKPINIQKPSLQPKKPQLKEQYHGRTK
jgi:hypothetical protein